MILAKKVRIYPNKFQEQKLWQAVGTARFIYNWTLARQEENYKNGGKFISDNDLRKEITKLKKTNLSWLNEVSNNIPKQAVKDCCLAYKRFFNKLANKPKFKSKKRSRASFYNDPVKLKIKEKEILIEKIGWIKIKEQIPIGIKYTNPRVIYDNKYWYISVGIEKETLKESLRNISLGIDLGLKNFAVLSNGQIFKNINKTENIKKLEKKLRQKQRKCSKKYELNKIMKAGGYQFIKTKNIEKLENKIKLIYRKLSGIRNNYIHQVTNNIVKAKPYRIVIEDLNISGMMKNKYLSDSISKQYFYKFRQYMTYKSELHGIELIIADRYFPSSKICSECGCLKSDLKLKDRVYKCSHCGAIIDRDLNAAVNLSNYDNKKIA